MFDRFIRTSVCWLAIGMAPCRGTSPLPGSLPEQQMSQNPFNLARYTLVIAEALRLAERPVNISLERSRPRRIAGRTRSRRKRRKSGHCG